VYGFSSSFGSKQYIIDCSTVAIQQVQNKLSTTQREEQQPGRIELEVGDVLHLMQKIYLMFGLIKALSTLYFVVVMIIIRN
jgi:hypothetical protein